MPMTVKEHAFLAEEPRCGWICPGVMVLVLRCLSLTSKPLFTVAYL